MFQLTSQSIIQFASLILYAILIALLMNSKQVRFKKQFLVFLTAAMGISATSLLMNLQLHFEQLVLWKVLLPVFTTWSIIAYAHFITVYTNLDARKIIRRGYAWLFFTFVIAIFGFLTQGLNLFYNKNIIIYSGHVFNSLVYINDFIMVVMVFFVISILKNSREPEERNRTAYILAGFCFMIVVNMFKYLLQDYHYIFSSIGVTGNAIIISYTLLKYRLLNIQVLMRKWVVYTGVTICVTLAYLALLLGLSNLLRLLPPQLGIPVTILMVVLFGFLFNWIKTAMDKAADKLFYGNRYAHRQMLLNFAAKMNNLLNIGEIANAMIIPLAKMVKAKQVTLLLPCNDYFTSKYVGRLAEEEKIVPVTVQKKSQLIKWLEENGIPFIQTNPQYEPIYQALSTEDKNALISAQIEVLCPIISKRQLVGILALSRKHTGHYTRDEVDLVTILARESAVAIENSQIYASAKEEADKDGLTGLYNHRYFQEALNREIEQCSLSGDDFSLLFIDLDFFKTYNDIYGHILGDEILKDVGCIIMDLIRETDIGVRYGGDEFAIILKGTSTDGAKIVAERIRSKLEASMNEKGILLTCSIGIACWRTDGVMRGTIIQAADEALYSAKQAGRNQVCLASKTDTLESLQTIAVTNPNDFTAIENIVFALASTVDARDHYTFGHSKAVSKYATELAKEIGYPKDGIRRIRAAALLHDIGKLNLSDNLLTKNGPLTDEEWQMIKNHPELGLNILKYVVGLRDCIDTVLYHHERWDGTGYPRGLKEKDIPLDARIVAIADAYDAMVSERCYKVGKLTEEEAIEELMRCAGTQFDPDLVESYIKIRKKALLVASYAKTT